MIKPNLGCRPDLEWDTFRIQPELEFLRCATNIGRPIFVAARMHVWRYNRNAYPGSNRVTGKVQCRGHIFGTVVDPWKKMAMKVNHARLEEYPLL